MNKRTIISPNPLTRRLFGVMVGVCAMALATSSLFGAGGNLGNGTGTEADPYLIEDRADFDEFCSDTNCWSGHTRLMTDLDLSGTTYDRAPIAPDTAYGSGNHQGTRFTGVFDGNGHAISGLTIDNVSSKYVGFGLFGAIEGVSSAVRNLVIVDASVHGSGGRDVGCLCGILSEGALSECRVTGTLLFASTGKSVGVLCGANDGGTVSKCRVAGSVSCGNFSRWIGGLCGYHSEGTMEKCHAESSVTVGEDSTFIGGLCGKMEQGVISDCYATGVVTGDGASEMGGLCGWNLGGTISKVYATGEVSGGHGHMRGLCGKNEGVITACFWDMETVGLTLPDDETRKTTAEMQNEATFTDAGWDFMGESANGQDDTWVLDGYPVFARDVDTTHTVTFYRGSHGSFPDAGPSGNLYITVADGAPVPQVTIDIDPGYAFDGWVPAPPATITDDYDGAATYKLGLNAGDGSPRNPYRIRSLADFNTYRSNSDYWSGHARLETDLDLAGITYAEAPIAASRNFSGVFDGDGRTISNLTIDTAGADTDFLGLFGRVYDGIDEDAVIMDLRLDGAAITGGDGSRYVGALCGRVLSGSGVSRCVVSNCSASVTLEAGDNCEMLGGLCGNLRGSMYRCVSTGSVQGGANALQLGGLVGLIVSSTIDESFTTVDVTGGTGATQLGGFCGKGIHSALFKNCYARGSVTGGVNADRVAGFSGTLDEFSRTENCYAVGAVSGGSGATGVSGFNAELTGGSSTAASFYDSETTGQSTSYGGTAKTHGEMQRQLTFTAAGWDFLGESANGTDSIWCMDDYPVFPWTITLTGDGSEANPYLIENLADFHGYCSDPELWRSHARLMTDLDLSGITYDRAPIAPDRDDGTLRSGPSFKGVFDGDGHVNRNLTINAAGVGTDDLALFGRTYGAGASISNLGVVDVSISGGEGSYGVGSLCGLNRSGTIAGCYASGAVATGTRAYSIGGLCGYNADGGTIRESYANVAVSGADQTYNLGGLCGVNWGSTIVECYSTGRVTGNPSIESIGGLCGSRGGGATATACFWDTETSGQSTSDGGTGKTTAEMQNQHTFTEAGWDFYGETVNGTDYIWVMDGYPVFADDVATKYLVRLHPGPDGDLAEANDGEDYKVWVAEDGVFPQVTVTPDAGKEFTGWSPAKPATITANYEGTAQYQAAQYTLTFHPGDHGDIDGVAPGADYVVTLGHNADFPTVTVTPDAGREFIDWDPPTPPKVTADYEGTARYAAETYTLRFDPGSYGYVDVAGVVHGDDYVLTLQHGAAVPAVPVVANSPYGFDGWNPAPPATATADFSALAQYSLGSYTVEFDLGAHGTRTGGGALTQTVAHANSATAPLVTEMAGSDWVFTGWDHSLVILADTTVNAVYLKKGDMGGGDGTAGNPYLIENMADFHAFRTTSSYWSGHTRLLIHIDLSGTTYDKALFAPDTSTTAGFQGTAFTGCFDGGGHEINYLVITGTGNSYLGAFGRIGAGGCVSNLSVTIDAMETVAGVDYVGILCGENLGSIDRCCARANALPGINAHDNVGGLCGCNSAGGTISNSYAKTEVWGNEAVGGLVGRNTSGATIDTCYSASTVTGTSNAGDFCGNQQGTVSSSFVESGSSGGMSGGASEVTLAEMQSSNTYINAGWDFVNESANGTDEIWAMAAAWLMNGRAVHAWDTVVSHDVTLSEGDHGTLVGAEIMFLRHGDPMPTITIIPDENYQHTGWDPPLPAVVTNTFRSTAQYSPADRTLTYMPGAHGAIVNPNSGSNRVVTVPHGGSFPAVDVTADEGWEFDGWMLDPLPPTVTQDYEFEAIYARITYPVDFMLDPHGAHAGGGELSQDVVHGGAAEAPIVANVPGSGWFFTGWDTNFSHVTEGMIVNAVYVEEGDLGGGTGSAGNPYLIENLADFMTYAGEPACWTGHARLAADIDLTTVPFLEAPIAPDGGGFEGVFDGDGHTLSNLTIIAEDKENVGLFGLIDGGVVSNLTLTGASVSGPQRAGALCGQSESGRVVNCHVSGVIEGAGGVYRLGGLCGMNTLGELERCSASCVVTGQSFNVVNFAYAGGLCGYNSGGSLTECFATGNVFSDAEAGGLCGASTRNGGTRASIRRCFATGSVAGGSDVGGLCGLIGFSTVEDCYASGSVDASRAVAGGLFGSGDDGESVMRCYSIGSVTGSSAIGGFCSRATGVTAGFWDVDNSGIGASGDDNDGATGKTTAEMRAEATFTGVGWDFVTETANGTDDVWIMDGYPELVWNAGTVHTVTLRPGTGGSIAEANSGADYIGGFVDGAPFPTITVVPDAGRTFTGWSVPLPGTVTANIEATAQYDVNTYTLTFHPGAKGAIDGANSGDDHVLVMTHGDAFPAVSVTQDAGWTFTGWQPSTSATVTAGGEYTAAYERTDMDGDRMWDLWEQQIVQADGGDGINTVYDVDRMDSFVGDGVKNLLKYAFGLDPTTDELPYYVPGTSTPGLPYMTFDLSTPGEEKAVVEYLRRRQGSLVYEPRWTYGLGTWWEPVEVAPTVTPVDDDWEHVRYEHPIDPSRVPNYFVGVRVRAVEP